MRLRVEGEGWRRSVPAHFDVVRAARADGHTLVRQVGNRQETAISTLFHHVQLGAELFYLVVPLAGGLLDLDGVQPLPFRTRDFIAGSVLFPLEPFELGQNPAAARFQRCEVFELA